MSDVSGESGLSLGFTLGSTGNLVLGWENEALTGPIVATAAVSGLGPEMLQSDQGSAATAWQTPTGVVSAGLTLVRRIGTVWRAFALARTNLTPSATVDWVVFNGGFPVYAARSEPVQPGFAQTVHVAPADVQGDTLTVGITDTANPQAFLNVPLLYAGPAWQPARNFGYGSQITADEQSTTVTTRSGVEYVRTDWVRRGFDLQLGAVTAEEVWTRLVRLDRFARTGGNVLFVPAPGDAMQNAAAVFGRLRPAAPIGYANGSARTRSWRATITERL